MVASQHGRSLRLMRGGGITMTKYEGLLVYQRISGESLPLFVFAAPAGELLSWSKILQTAKVKGAAQRLENLATFGAFVLTSRHPRAISSQPRLPSPSGRKVSN